MPLVLHGYLFYLESLPTLAQCRIKHTNKRRRCVRTVQHTLLAFGSGRLQLSGSFETEWPIRSGNIQQAYGRQHGVQLTSWYSHNWQRPCNIAYQPQTELAFRSSGSCTRFSCRIRSSTPTCAACIRIELKAGVRCSPQ